MMPSRIWVTLRTRRAIARRGDIPLNGPEVNDFEARAEKA